ncbi:glucan phosphoethanolaminetransferase (alkaline phosphatase superfamily) [Arthrobacter sp. JUb119]|uniref:hypothetical protein n=1 Tax=Micrococcaceae TaxID=1268 RepID=UPI000CFC2633|nr:hypothetical protein [Arthrobacter sp. MYb222]MCS3493746.1 glucan phosphoethanolaminetransferase (alkaline phosphatase superfamily) [Arthrobacter sp. JUb119]PQZ89709.1 hypothetical protein CQ016_02295 [Arthrobacter sp. MYb222]
MRKLLAISGFAMIVAYAAYGSLLMNNWAVTAASGLSLDETISEMASMDQNYDSLGGWVFAATGTALAISWLVPVVSAGRKLPAWAAIGAWSLIIALGAPAYFFASFANMNSVGDTFADWNADAAADLAAPLYMASVLAFAILAAMAAFGIRTAFTRPPRPLHPTSN